VSRLYIVPLLTGKVSRLKELACEEIPLRENSDEHVTPTYNSGTDPTIANAGLIELEDPTTSELANGAARLTLKDTHTSAGPPTGSIDEGAANAAADVGWDPTQSGAQEDPLTESYEIVPRDPIETETGAPLATATNLTQSWSEEPGDWATTSVTEGNGAPSGPARQGRGRTNGAGNDGFHEVKHHGGRGGRGGFRGSGGGQHRGGFRGGRGGGGFRGGERGGQRGRGGFRGRGRGD
jgi:hypothetical protein